MPQFKQCPQCHAPAQAIAAICAQCGHVYRTQFVQPTQTSRGTQSATAAILLSLIIPGAGQVYNRQHAKALGVFLSFPGWFILGWSAIAVGSGSNAPALFFLAPVFWLCVPLGWFAQVIDAAMVAGRLNRGENVGPWTSF